MFEILDNFIFFNIGKQWNIEERCRNTALSGKSGAAEIIFFIASDLDFSAWFSAEH